MDLSGLSDQDLEAIAAGDMGKVSEMGLNVLAGVSSLPGSPLAPGKTVVERLVPSLERSPEARLAAHEQEQARAGRQQAFSQAEPKEQLKALLGFRPDLSTTSDAVAGAPPLAIPGGAGTDALVRAGQAISSSMPRRMAASTVAGALKGGIKGAIDKDSTAAQGALEGGAEGFGAGALGELLGFGASKISDAAKWGGAKLANMDPRIAEAYQKYGAQAEQMLKQMQEQPEQFQSDVIAKNKALLQEMQQKIIDPKLQARGEASAGKSFAVNPEDFTGTAAEPIIQDAWAKVAPTKEAVVKATRVHQPEFTPVSATQVVRDLGESPITAKLPVYGRPKFRVGSVKGGTFEDLAAATAAREQERQGVSDMLRTAEQQQIARNPWIDPNTGQVKTVPIGEVQKQIVQSGPVQKLPNVLEELQLRTKYQPTAPKSVRLTAEQGFRARSAAGKAADVAYKANPTAYSAGDDREAMAAASLGKALHAISPKAEALDSEISKAIRMKGGISRLGNPANILKDSDTLAGMPMAAVRDYVDTTLGTSLGGQAKALAGAQKLQDIDSMWKGDIARSLLSRAKSSAEAAQILKELGMTYEMGGVTKTLGEGGREPQTKQSLVGRLLSGKE